MALLGILILLEEFFIRYVPHWFSKVGSVEFSGFLGLNLGSWEQIFTKICVSGAEI